MQEVSGYKTITPLQFANALAAQRSGAIDLSGLRIYFACFALVAIREAAGRRRRKRRETQRGAACYRMKELERLTGLSAARTRRGLRKLDRSGLVRFTEGEIHFEHDTLPGSEELQTLLSCRRSPRRPIPVPRAVLRLLARTENGCLLKTILAYVVRGLSLSRRGGDVSAKGTIKASWISTSFAISHRSVKYAQARLQQWKWVSKDTKSFQRKLNRDGAYFVINLDWKSDISPEKEKLIVIPHKPTLSFAPPPAENCMTFAPPIENRKTSDESKNQNAQMPEPQRHGVFNSKAGEETKADLPSPDLNHIRSEDFHQFSRLECLYFEALERGWVDRSEATALNFIAAAVKAREEGKDPARLFISIVRRGLWQHINHGHEERARAVLNRFREENPDRFRASALRVPRKQGDSLAA